MQELHTKHRGSWKFIQTWSDNGVHLGLLPEGGYAHVNGLSIESPNDFRMSMAGDLKALEAALYWWEHKDELAAQAVERFIIIKPDGTYEYDDGSPITDPAELMRYFANDKEAQKSALTWFAKKMVAEEAAGAELAKARQTKAGKTASAIKGKKTTTRKANEPPTVTAKEPPPLVKEPEVALKD